MFNTYDRKVLGNEPQRIKTMLVTLIISTAAMAYLIYKDETQ